MKRLLISEGSFMTGCLLGQSGKAKGTSLITAYGSGGFEQSLMSPYALLLARWSDRPECPTVAGDVAPNPEGRAARGHLEGAGTLVERLEAMTREPMRLVDGLSFDAMRGQAGGTTGRGRTADPRDGSGTRCPWKTPAGFMHAGGLDLETFVLQSRETLAAPERARSALVTKKGGHNPPTNGLAERPGKLLRYCRE